MALCANGHENPDGNRFCSECGSPVENGQTGLPTTPPAPISGPPVRSDSQVPFAPVAENGPGNRFVLLIGGIVVVLAVAFGVFLLVSHEPSHTVVGTFTVSDAGDATLGIGPSIGGTDNDCYGTGGYSDISSGASVTVKDGQGRILATSSLGSGSGTILGIAAVCTFRFKVVVPDSGFYSVEVGHRGSLDFSRDQLASKGWHVDLTLGG